MKKELDALQKAEFNLISIKWYAERQMTEVKIIPTGMSAAKAKADARSIKDQVESMSSEKAAELLAILEARLGKSEPEEEMDADYEED